MKIKRHIKFFIATAGIVLSLLSFSLDYQSRCCYYVSTSDITALVDAPNKSSFTYYLSHKEFVSVHTFSLAPQRTNCIQRFFEIQQATLFKAIISKSLDIQSNTIISFENFYSYCTNDDPPLDLVV